MNEYCCKLFADTPYQLCENYQGALCVFLHHSTYLNITFLVQLFLAWIIHVLLRFRLVQDRRCWYAAVNHTGTFIVQQGRTSRVSFYPCAIPAHKGPLTLALCSLTCLCQIVRCCLLLVRSRGVELGLIRLNVEFDRAHLIARGWRVHRFDFARFSRLTAGVLAAVAPRD